MVPVFTCGMECGVAGSAGHHWAATGTATFDTGTFNNGLRAARIHPAAGAARFLSNISLGGTLGVLRFYINVATAPATDTLIAGFNNPAQLCGLVYKSSDGKFYAGTDDTSTVLFGATGTTLSAGWHYVDIRVNVVANPWVIEVSVDGTALGTHSPANAADTIGTICLGTFQVESFDIYFDDIIASKTTGDFPIGTGKVLSFVPNADGTHTSTTTEIVKGTAAVPVGAAITSATTDAFNWVNARPIGGGATDATRLINQQTVATTHYAEVDFEPTAEVNAPRAVEVITADQQATTASGGFSTKLNDNGTEDVIITRSAAGVVTDRFVTKQYATMVGGGAWTLTRFNALKARFGYSGDATPDQYWRGIMIEAEFPLASGTGRPVLPGFNSPRFQSPQRRIL